MSTIGVKIRQSVAVCRLQPCIDWSARLGVVLLLACLAAGPASAMRVPGLFGADVDATGASGSGLDAAFDAALSQVLVKVTGLSEAGDPAARKRLFPNPAALVQQYSFLPGNRLRVEFDPAALRRALDSAGLPLWDADRPLVVVWLAIDTGDEARAIVADGAATDANLAAAGIDEIRTALLTIAGERGLPVVLPLMDAEDITRVSFEDVWGDTRDPVLAASERYGAEAVLIGRARSLDINDTAVRWTLLAGEQEANWEGSIAAGPAEAAAVLSRQLATFADSGGVQRVVVTGVDDLAQYGSLLQYFRSLAIVERADIVRIDGRSVEFNLAVRGDATRLQRTLDSSALLVSAPSAGATAGLVYAFRTVR